MKRSFILLLLLLMAALLHTTTSTVYYVMPDNHYHPINDNTYTLQHYLNNTNKYFTSNTQLYFLPGQYYLNNDLMIQGVSNFTLVGNRINEVINTVINCTSPAGIVVVGSSNTVIANIVMNGCGNYYDFFETDGNRIIRKYLISLFIFNCNTLTCNFFHSFSSHKPSGLVLFNVRENTTLEKIISSYLTIHHTEESITTFSSHFLKIDDLQINNDIKDKHAIEIEHTNVSYEVKITNVAFTSMLAVYLNCIECSNHSTTFSECSFTGQHETSDFVDDGSSANEYSGSGTHDNFVDISYKFAKIFGIYTYVNYRNEKNQIQFEHCSFINNSYPRILIQIHTFVRSVNFTITDTSVAVINCMFSKNSYVQILSIEEYSGKRNARILSSKNFGDIINQYKYTLFLLMENVTISLHMEVESGIMIFAYHTNLIMNKVIINDNQGVRGSSIIDVRYGDIKFLNYNEFSNNFIYQAVISMLESLIFVQENSILSFMSNNITKVFDIDANTKGFNMCPLQYISTRGNLDAEFEMGIKLNYSIELKDNYLLAVSDTDLVHCSWHPSSAFQKSSPLHINRAIIMNDNPLTMQQKKDICLCINKSLCCYLEEMGPIYPGQTLSFHLASTVLFTKAVFIEALSYPYITCKSNGSSLIQLDSNSCTKVEYIIKHPSGRWCELGLQTTAVDLFAPNFNRKWIEMYTIVLKPCPKGFSLHSEGYCQCDNILLSHIASLTHCNIDDQTIPRPANSWISAHTVNNSHSYHVSLHCPFDYCLPHSSHLNLSTPDSQCQFNRSGLLCGQCQQGLSAVFGSSQCKQCSNIYLLIIIPIAIAGLVLVLLFFALNLTVTNGDINGFLLYVNIISINTSIFFPHDDTAVHAFISLANLDLGITTCFYNGMDSYAKIWLQLTFPAYLILIALSLIIASRYSGRIQRLTARRALPVLATLFLLSYTKVLLTVSSVLFFYSTTTHLPRNETIVWWLVDPTVPKFGVKFTILFAVCLILFLALISFNMVLIFTRTLAQFKVINHFKPLLDAYQGPYKIKFYYWNGLQLLIRAVFFGLSALDKSLNVMVSILLLGVLIWSSEKFSLFKRKGTSLVEILFLLNLFVMFTITISRYDAVNSAMISTLISLAMLQFVCIVILHLKVFLFETFPKCEMILDRELNKCFYALRNLRGREDPRCQLELVNPVPEKDYNYEKLQDSLVAIGQY